MKENLMNMNVEIKCIIANCNNIMKEDTLRMVLMDEKEIEEFTKI